VAALAVYKYVLTAIELIVDCSQKFSLRSKCFLRGEWLTRPQQSFLANTYMGICATERAMRACVWPLTTRWHRW
jgi:hypothetical protein